MPHLSAACTRLRAPPFTPQPGPDPKLGLTVPQLPSMLHQTTFDNSGLRWERGLGVGCGLSSNKLPTAPQLEGLEWCRPADPLGFKCFLVVQ